MSSQIKTRLLLLSDTHARVPQYSALPPADVAIHTGDLTMTGKVSEHEQAMNLLKGLQAHLKIVIPGNHDLTLDATYYAEKGHLYGPRPKYTAAQLQQIRDLYTGAEAQAANIVYLEEGTQTFQLRNSATFTVYASAYTPEFCDWAFAYPRNQDRFNPSDAENPVSTYNSPNVANIDVMLTHGPPFGILDRVNPRQGGSELHVGCEHLFRAVDRARPLVHCFGHIHEGWGALRKTWIKEPGFEMAPSAEEPSTNCSPIAVDIGEMAWNMSAHTDATDLKRGSETLFVNSSIMDLRYKPTQAAWMVDLMLHKGQQALQ